MATEDTATPHTTPAETWERLRDGGLVLCLGLAAVVHARAFMDYAFEDAYITFRYASNLARGHGFVFNPGEWVLGTSTPLWTLLLATLGWLGFDIPTAATWIYSLSASVAGGLGALLLRRCGHANAGVLFGLAAAWGLGSGSMYCGMETALYLALILGSLLAAERQRVVATGVLLGLTCLTRYDGGVVAMAVGFHLWWVRGRPPWREAMIASMLVVPWLLFALWTFGSVLPNTLGAKAGDSDFLRYVAKTVHLLALDSTRPVADLLPTSGLPIRGARVLVALVAAAPAVALARTVGRRAPILVLCPGVAVALLVGYGLIGPPVEHRWYHVPTFQLGLLFGLAAWSHLWARRPGWTRGWPQRAMLVLIALTLWALPGAIDRRGDAYLETQGRIRAYDQFIDWIVSNGLTDTSILTREPGYITYHTGQRAIDAAGLVTEGIYFHGPEQRRTDLLALVEQHRPDFLVRPRMPTPELLRHYVPVVEVPRVRILLMRRDLHRLHSSGPGLIFEDGFEGGDTGYWTTPGR